MAEPKGLEAEEEGGGHAGEEDKARKKQPKPKKAKRPKKLEAG